jgi:hypothetical protein
MLKRNRWLTQSFIRDIADEFNKNLNNTIL